MKIASFILYAPCPCGSGKKFKFCHFEAVRGDLPDNPAMSEVTMAVRKSMQPFGMVNGVDPVEDREAIALMREGMRTRDSEGFGPALALFRRAREMKPRLFTAWNDEAQCLWYLERFDEAVARQEEGLALSADCNAFGWAQLAMMNHCLDRDSGRDMCLARSVAIPPISHDAAIKVCESLALAAHHHDIPLYIRDSGFIDIAAVSFFAGVAAANAGQTEQALGLLGLLPEDIPQRELVDRIVRDLSTGRRDAVTPLGIWPYFNPASYPGAPLIKKVTSKAGAKYRNATCDLVEIMFAYGKLPVKGAQAMIALCGGPRAATLMDALGRLLPIPKELKRSLFPKRPAKASDKTDETTIRHQIITTAEFEDDLMDKETTKIFARATKAIATSRPGTKRFSKAREDLENLLKRYPDHYRLEFNYATALERAGECEEAIQRIEKIAAEHPQYVFAHAALIDIALAMGDIARAGEVYKAFRQPKHIHPEELRAWCNTALRYATAAGLKDEAKYIRDNLKQLAKLFPDL